MVVQHIIRNGTSMLPLMLRRRAPRSSCCCLPWSAVAGGTSTCADVNQSCNRPGRRPFSSTSTAVSPRNAPTSASSSVSAKEVAHFDALASTWWDADRNPLIAMNPTRVSYIVETLLRTTTSRGDGNKNPSLSPSASPPAPSRSPQRPLHGLRALDVGCGGGLLSESLARLGASVCAIDPSAKVANAAREHSQHHPLTKTIDYRGGTSVEELARELTAIGDDNDPVHVVSDNTGTNAAAHPFDLVCVLEVVEHATDPQSLLDSACRLLRPGGLLFVSTLNRTAKSYILAIAGAEHIMRMVPVGTHKWEKFLSPVEVGGMITSSKEAKMEVVDICGMVLKPPFIDMNWTLDRNDVDVNWIGAYRKEE